MKKILLIALICISNKLAFSQNVGIGTKNPTRAKLELHGAVGSTVAIFGGDTSGISLQSNWPTIGFNEYYNNGHRYIARGFAAQQFLDPVNGYMAFDFFGPGNANTAATNSKRVLAMGRNGDVIVGDITGRVGINKTPDVDPRFNAALQIRQTTGGPAKAITITDVTGAGTWGITSNYAAGVGGFFSLDYNGTGVGYFDGFDGKYFNASDSRLKKDINSLAPVLSKVMQLEPVQYKLKASNDSARLSTGFIAQQVKKIFPELVTILPDASTKNTGLSDVHAVNYTTFSVIAIKAIQEQQTVIESLQQQLTKIAAELSALKQSHK